MKIAGDITLVEGVVSVDTTIVARGQLGFAKRVLGPPSAGRPAIPSALAPCANRPRLSLEFATIRGAPAARNQQRQPQGKAQEQPQVHGGEQHVVPPVVEVRDAPLRG